MVSEGAAERGTRTLRAELALKTLTGDLEPHERLHAILEQMLVFTGAAVAAVYTPDSDLLSLVASAGVPRNLYGLRDSYRASGEAPVAEVCRSGQPRRFGPAELHRDADVRRAHVKDFSLAVLPLPERGCLVAVTDDADGFDAEERECLELLAEAVTSAVPPVGAGAVFDYAMDTGQVEVGDEALELFGIGPDDFDGRVETLMALTVPEDLPSLMSVVEADHGSLGERELEFRIQQPSGEQKWLRLRGRLLPGDEGRPVRLVGTVADASTMRSGLNDVARIQRLAAALATAGTVRDVSQAVVTALRAPLQADRIALAELEGDRLVVTVLDPPQPEAWPEVWRSEWRSEWPDAPVRTMPTLAAALRDGRAAIWPAGTPLEPALADVGPGGLAVLPLPAGGRMAGACLIGWDGPHEFGTDERALLTAAAGLAGQALLRAHAFDAEHELVDMLQRTLLPRRLPQLPGAVAIARYLPTTAGLEVGGDWYDVIPLPDNHVALVIGDVQGHNVGAATLMGQMRTALRAYAVEGHPPDVVVSHANRLLVDMETDLFATCCYVDIDMEEGSAWFVRAGHLPPVLRHPDGTTVITESEGGPPLGVLPQADFPMTALRLTPGTLLALTTDGLVESADIDAEDGLDHLADELSASDPAHLGTVADTLLAGANRDDDVALLLMRYDGMALRPQRENWTVWRVPQAVGHARRYTRRVLRAWGVEAEADAVLLVVSELVTNALVHTDGKVRLDLTLLADRLRVAVADASPRTPRKPPSIGWEATGGRGILLVEAMSSAWGTVPVSGGKQVWAEVPIG
ncbi:SpoIIE family protein phosphatase [Streptomyces ipomoeae]|uniref:SpoIIE family protein phosphatase n=2 Tax=Streptomyces ipomoeae TaxID=103232 RepID=UPI001146EEE9|nr:SpoIIE family protein phosphatase [Streptomyces ipomoeae]MDX2695874.1 SpoIIE family protein phosphatase [Streptomyces ipomoeae]MDX2824057.1 SpoIIE family protein phosphatase [Streptomyces ipomoeae]MDX2841214.1 SpoIIE family protein phosphatase [Streptomyces ipomoeae]MDX2875895.1 SpoIIE family protein phosphatase [Streptomyces ipomoeae]TQE26535.1 GAF domain-containing protein [Streptomyces ipomoeae]